MPSAMVAPQTMPKALRPLTGSAYDQLGQAPVRNIIYVMTYLFLFFPVGVIILKTFDDTKHLSDSLYSVQNVRNFSNLCRVSYRPRAQ